MTRRGILAAGLPLAIACAALACGSDPETTQEPNTTPPEQPVPVPPAPQPPRFVMGTPGPWPVENVRYGAEAGILETPVVSMTTDEAQNRWVATQRALYLLRPGEATFTRFDAEDGLNLGAASGREPGPVGWAKYCNMRPIADDAPCNSGLLWGGASAAGIRTIVGGGEDEVFVGYSGAFTPGTDCPEYEHGDADACDPLRHSGKIDWVRLRPDGTLDVVRFDLVSNLMGAQFWHDRTMYRLAYDHFVNKGTLYAAGEHGVSVLYPAKYRPPAPGEWFDVAYSEYMGDHLHARVCAPGPCDDLGTGQRMGDWLGLEVDGQGRLWHAGKWSAGRITWAPDPVTWVARNGTAFDAAFGDPYLGPGTGGEPVFEVAQSGDPVHLSAVSVCPDGRVWFASTGVASGPAAAAGLTVAAWEGTRFRTYTAAQVGLAEASVKDLVCLPDGRVVVAGFNTGLSVFDPDTGSSTAIRASGGLLPSDRILQLEIDRMPVPATLHVATGGGAAAIRVVP